MPQAILSISPRVISDILQLPEDYKVVTVHYNHWRQTIDLTMESEALPEHQEGKELPRVNPIYRREPAEEGEQIVKLVDIKVEK